MFQVVVQSAMRLLKAKLKLRAPPSNLGEEKTPQEKKILFDIFCGNANLNTV